LILVKEEARKMLEAGITSLGQVNGVKNVVSD
jgi:hypothetical protein